MHRLDDPVERSVLLATPRRIVEGTPPVLVDEWQRYPPSWDLVRRAVDDERVPGRFLLTVGPGRRSAGPTPAYPRRHPRDRHHRRAPDQRVVAIEVKLGSIVDDPDVRHLHWLADQIGPDLLDAVVITTGPEAYRRGDGIAVVPAALLGP